VNRPNKVHSPNGLQVLYVVASPFLESNHYTNLKINDALKSFYNVIKEKMSLYNVYGKMHGKNGKTQLISVFGNFKKNLVFIQACNYCKEK
jgi:predicted phosphohydrolase